MSLKDEDNFSSQDDDEIAIRVEHVSKKFSRSLKRSMLYGMKDIAKNVFRMSSNSDRLRKSEFWALKDVSFEVRKGECFGIIGPNGAGKTTILSLLNGIYMPDEGKITIKGKTGALIALGAGFHPMLTGRENVFIKGAVLGMDKTEIEEKFDDIVEFADIGDFLDMPVKNYSSGMFVRLGFAVAIHCEPEILLIDEVLSVGDLRFRERSQSKFMELVDNGTSVVFVSHSLEAVRRTCDKVLLLNQGSVVDLGDAETVVNNYTLLMNREELKSIKKRGKKYTSLSERSKLETGKIELFNCEIFEEKGNPNSNEIGFGKNIVIEFQYRCFEEIENPEFIVTIDSVFDRKRIAHLRSIKSSLPASLNGEGTVKFVIRNNILHQGLYSIGIEVLKLPAAYLFVSRHHHQFIIKNLEPIDSTMSLLVDFDYTVEIF